MFMRYFIKLVQRFTSYRVNKETDNQKKLRHDAESNPVSTAAE